MNVKHLPPEEMKGKVLRFRVTDEEHKKFMKLAKSTLNKPGIGQLSKALL